jgi:N-acetylglucosamine malate deacetylase 1
MNVLVIAPHPDDEAIGCGGTVAVHTSRGDRVVVVFLTSGELGLKHLPRERAWAIREKEARAAAKVLGVANVSFLRRADWFLEDDVDAALPGLGSILTDESPGRIYLPHPDEWHPDHKLALALTRRALEGVSCEPSLLMYEVWTPLSVYDHLVDVSAVMAQKLRAIRCYRSQLKAFRYDRAIRGLNEYRGHLAAHSRYAEVFKNA